MEKNRKLRNIIEYAKQSSSYNINEMILHADYVCVWGVGLTFFEAYESLFRGEAVKIDYLIDSDKEKQGRFFLDGIKCISPEQLAQLTNPLVIAFVYSGIDEIAKFCEQERIPWIHRSHWILDKKNCRTMGKNWLENNEKRIFECYDLLEDEKSKRVFEKVLFNRMAHGYKTIEYATISEQGEYFAPKGAYVLGENEYYLDVGAYIGDSIENFLETVRYKFNKISALEIDPYNYSLLSEKVNGYEIKIKDRIECINRGAWNENTNVVCNNVNGISCTIVKEKQENVVEYHCDKIDELLHDQTVTLIKMDIEGAEMEALEGARGIIENQTPKLSICIYHKLEDFWEIPLLIKEMVPDYHIAIRHHSVYNSGTVCYAWKD